MNWKVLSAGLVVSLGLVILLSMGFGRDPQAIPYATIGKAAPDFELETLSGTESISMAELHGTPVVFNFWASWCQPCLQEHQALLQVARDPDFQHVRFIGVLYQDDIDTARAYLQRHGQGYPTVVDSDGSIAIDFGVTGVPETYFVNADGVILQKYKGPVDIETLHEKIRSIS